MSNSWENKRLRSSSWPEASMLEQNQRPRCRSTQAVDNDRMVIVQGRAPKRFLCIVRTGGPLPAGTELLSSQPKPNSGPEIRGQSGESHHLVVMVVQEVFHVEVGRNSRGQSVPPTEVQTSVAGRMVKSKAFKI